MSGSASSAEGIICQHRLSRSSFLKGIVAMGLCLSAHRCLIVHKALNA